MNANAEDPGAPNLEFEALFREIISSVPPRLLDRARAVATQSATEVTQAFYRQMLDHPKARFFLDNALVTERLTASMTRWIEDLFAPHIEDDLAPVIARQVLVGHVHARINLPAELMQVGLHVMARELSRRCAAAITAPRDALLACRLVMELLHLAGSVMLGSYIVALRARAKKEEAYRVISLDHDVSLERERQRAALSEWSHHLLFDLRQRARTETLESLGDSEFGLWIKHKATLFFDGMQELDEVMLAMRAIDEDIVPRLRALPVDDAHTDVPLQEFAQRIDSIRFLVSDLFARLGRAGLGWDATTRLLNQRYVPVILGREIGTHGLSLKPFSVLQLRIDNLRKLVFVDEGDGRDMVIQQIAACIMDAIRAGDHAFRLGDECFLCVLVETDLKQATAIAEEIRLKVRSREFHLSARKIRRITVSAGVVQFQGHPDYQPLMRAAEDALARATEKGGDRVASAT